MPATASRAAAPSPEPSPQPVYTSSGPLLDPTSILGGDEPGSRPETDKITAATPTTPGALQGEPSSSVPPTTDSTPATGLSNETQGRRRVHWPPDDKLYDIRLVSPRPPPPPPPSAFASSP